MKLLFSIQAVLCALIVARLLLFRRDGAVHRPRAAWLAYGLTVLAGAVTIGVAFGRYEWALLAQIGITAVLCLALFAVRGNVVELFRMTGLTDGNGCRILQFLRSSSHDDPATR